MFILLMLTEWRFSFCLWTPHFLAKGRFSSKNGQNFPTKIVKFSSKNCHKTNKTFNKNLRIKPNKTFNETFNKTKTLNWSTVFLQIIILLSVPEAPFSAGSQLVNRPSLALIHLSEYYECRSLWSKSRPNVNEAYK